MDKLSGTDKITVPNSFFNFDTTMLQLEVRGYEKNGKVMEYSFLITKSNIHWFKPNFPSFN